MRTVLTLMAWVLNLHASDNLAGQAAPEGPTDLTEDKFSPPSMPDFNAEPQLR